MAVFRQGQGYTNLEVFLVVYKQTNKKQTKNKQKTKTNKQKTGKQ